ncbi:hypothetical protein [Polaromonas sp. CG9_12]|nr:hypothetical protein [Polaromonas sp. CG9_12]
MAPSVDPAQPARSRTAASSAPIFFVATSTAAATVAADPDSATVARFAAAWVARWAAPTSWQYGPSKFL